MSTALALISCEAQSIAAEGGLKSAEGKSNAPGRDNGFKKELEDCEAMAIPAQPEATNGSIPNAEAGEQQDPGVIQGLSGLSCVFEGIEVPEHPTDVAQTQGQTVDMPTGVIPVDGMAEGQQADSTPESNARMQQTEAGGTESTPVKTQDQILETVGAYIDQTAETGTEKAAQTGQAQTAAPLKEEQNPAAVKTAAGTAGTDEAQSGEGPAANAVQKPVVPGAADQSGYAAMDTAESTAADKTGSAAKGQSETAAAGKTEDIGKREPSAKADTTEETGKSYTSAPVADQEPAAAAKDTPVKAAQQPRTEEAAQFTKENVLRIVDKASTQAKEGRYDFEVTLKPEFLGKVNIKLTMEDGVIRMQIKTDDMSVRGMLTDQASSLQNALKEKGITLTSVDVTYESQASLDGGKQPFEQNDGQRRQGGMYYAHAEPTGYEPASDPYSYFVGNSSVEFLA